MNSVQSLHYRALVELIEQAQRVIDHPSFSERFVRRDMASMLWELFEVLAELFRSPDLATFDLSVAGESERPSPSGKLALRVSENWLAGLGTIETRKVLTSIVKSVYGDEKLDGQILATLRSAVTKLVDEVIREIHRSSFAGEGAYRAAQHARAALSESRLREVDRLLEEAETSVASIAEKEAIAEKTLGKISDLELAKHYDDFARTQSAEAKNFRRLTVIMALTAAGSALLFIVAPPAGWAWLAIPPDDFVHLIQRGIFVAAVLGLAGYFARQAHQHRSMANWAGSLAVQLQTFDAYLAAVENNEVKDELRKSFGARVFGDHPAMKGEPSATPSAAIADKALELAAKTIGR